MARKPAKDRQKRPAKVEVAVSRLEQHHVDALEGSALLPAAETLAVQRAAGGGFGLVAAVDGLPVGLLGVRFTDDGWALHDVAVDPAAGVGIEDRLVQAARELARPLGSLTLLDGTTEQLS